MAYAAPDSMKALILGAALAGIILVVSLLPTGSRRVSPLENISSVLYPELAGSELVEPVEGLSNIQVITESIAHADIQLSEPVLAKQLKLTVRYRPVNLKSLAVGVREDSFWLSYSRRQEIFRADNTPGVALAAPAVQEAQITIPLTDKFQETDRSLDLVFFAESESDPYWELHGLQARVAYAWPSWPEFKNYVRSVLSRERAL